MGIAKKYYDERRQFYLDQLLLRQINHLEFISLMDEVEKKFKHMSELEKSGESV